MSARANVAILLSCIYTLGCSHTTPVAPSGSSSSTSGTTLKVTVKPESGARFQYGSNQISVVATYSIDATYPGLVFNACLGVDDQSVIINGCSIQGVAGKGSIETRLFLGTNAFSTTHFVHVFLTNGPAFHTGPNVVVGNGVTVRFDELASAVVIKVSVPRDYTFF